MSPYRFAFALVLLSACGGQIDPNATEKTRTRQVGTETGSPGGSSGTNPTPPSAPGGSAGSCDASGLVPFEADFEGGVISDEFTVNSPSAFSIEWDEPIDGSASLRVKPNAASYLARKVKSVCAARLEFTLRATAEFISVGSHVARINAGSRRFSVFVGPGGVFLLEEISSTQLVSLGSGAPFGDVIPDEPTKFVLDVDVNANKATFGFTSAHGSGDTRVIEMANFPLEAPAAITSIEIGTTPGDQVTPQGLYWIDDIAIN